MSQTLPFPADPAPASVGPAQFVDLTFQRGVLTARLVGPSVGQREAPIIASEIRRAIERFGRAVRVLVLDLTDVTLICSMGLGMCIDVRNRAVKAKARSVLFGLSPEIDGLFRLMRIERLYKIARSEKDLRRLAA